MLQRITRSLIVFAVLVGAYQAYARLAAPLMEPPLAIRVARKGLFHLPRPEDHAGTRVSIARRIASFSCSGEKGLATAMIWSALRSIAPSSA